MATQWGADCCRVVGGEGRTFGSDHTGVGCLPAGIGGQSEIDGGCTLHCTALLVKQDVTITTYIVGGLLFFKCA